MSGKRRGDDVVILPSGLRGQAPEFPEVFAVRGVDHVETDHVLIEKIFDNDFSVSVSHVALKEHVTTIGKTSVL